MAENDRIIILAVRVPFGETLPEMSRLFDGFERTHRGSLNFSASAFDGATVHVDFDKGGVVLEGTGRTRPDGKVDGHRVRVGNE